MDKNKKIYIAGHNGMVGSAIMRNLQAKGYQNIVTRDFKELNLTRQNETESFFEKEKPSYVILAAAKVGGIVANNTYRAEFIYDNIMIQNNVIQAAYKNGVEKLLFLGSSCIYPKLAPQPLKEEYLLTGTLEFTNEPYAIAKIAGIKMCESYFQQYGCNYISVMPTNLYGPNDNYDLEKSHVLPALIRKMHLGKCLELSDWDAIHKDMAKNPLPGIHENSNQADIIKALANKGIKYNEPNATQPGVSIDLWGSGEVYREFLHVDDMADACVYLLNNVEAQKLYNDLNQTHINIGTGIDLTIKNLAEKIKQIVGYQGAFQWDTTKPDGTPKKQLDTSLLSQLGWEPRINLDKGVQSVYNLYIH